MFDNLKTVDVVPYNITPFTGKEELEHCHFEPYEVAQMLRLCAEALREHKPEGIVAVIATPERPKLKHYPWVFKRVPEALRFFSIGDPRRVIEQGEPFRQVTVLSKTLRAAYGKTKIFTHLEGGTSSYFADLCPVERGLIASAGCLLYLNQETN